MNVIACINCLSSNVGHDWLCDLCRETQFNNAPAGSEALPPHPLPCDEDRKGEALGRASQGITPVTAATPSLTGLADTDANLPASAPRPSAFVSSVGVTEKRCEI